MMYRTRLKKPESTFEAHNFCMPEATEKSRIMQSNLFDHDPDDLLVPNLHLL